MKKFLTAVFALVTIAVFSIAAMAGPSAQGLSKMSETAKKSINCNAGVGNGGEKVSGGTLDTEVRG